MHVCAYVSAHICMCVRTYTSGDCIGACICIYIHKYGTSRYISTYVRMCAFRCYVVCACVFVSRSVVVLCRFLVFCSTPYVQAAPTSPDVAVIKDLEDSNKQLAAEAAHAKGVVISLILPHPLLHTPPLSFLILLLPTPNFSPLLPTPPTPLHSSPLLPPPPPHPHFSHSSPLLPHSPPLHSSPLLPPPSPHPLSQSKSVGWKWS